MSGNSDWKDVLKSRQFESDRNWWIAFPLSAFFGWAGADRFYLHQFVLGSLKLITFGGLFLWWAADIVLLLVGLMADADGLKLVPPWKAVFTCRPMPPGRREL